MFKVEKYYPKGYKPQHNWSDKYSREHIAGTSSDDFKKQGFWPLMEKYFDKEKKYLDAGCGIGGWILFLRDNGYDVEGIDVAPRCVRALTEYDPEIKVKVASMTAIPYGEKSMDGVLAIGSLEYIENKVPDAIRDVHRVLKTRGIFFMEVPVANVIRRLFYIPLKRLERAIKVKQGERPVFGSYLFDRDELKQMLRAAGFDVIEEKPHELPDQDGHYGLYIDWPFLRGRKPYKLNGLGEFVKQAANSFSPWAASTGAVLVARKK